ncbi:MAG: exonuclease domain-containing protein [Synergistes sp.]|nr:exonuclease domain-containing protein [Synergistes sp.]
MIINAVKHLPECDDFTFTAIDFERANNSYASVCQVGVCTVRGGEIVDKAEYLVRPRKGIDYFLPQNTAIHGITEKDVDNAPTFAEVWNEIAPHICGYALAAHSFRDDEKTLAAALKANRINYNYEKYGHICTLELAIRTKTHGDDNKYNLEALSKHFGITIVPHHAGADAEACAKLVLAFAHSLSVTSLKELASISQEPDIHFPEFPDRLTCNDIDKLERFIYKTKHKKDLTISDYPKTHLLENTRKILQSYSYASLDAETALSAKALSLWVGKISSAIRNRSRQNNDNGWWYRKMRNKKSQY